MGAPQNRLLSRDREARVSSTDVHPSLAESCLQGHTTGKGQAQTQAQIGWDTKPEYLSPGHQPTPTPITPTPPPSSPQLDHHTHSHLTLPQTLLMSGSANRFPSFFSPSPKHFPPPTQNRQASLGDIHSQTFNFLHRPYSYFKRQ